MFRRQLVGISAAWGCWAFSSAKAQSIGLPVGDSARTFAAPNGRIAVPIRGDLSTAGSLDLAAVQGTLSWDTQRLTLDSVRSAPNSAFTVTANLTTRANGTAQVSAFSPSPLAVSGPLFLAHFTVAAGAGSTRVGLTPSAAGTSDGTSILAAVRSRPLDVCITRPARWGDVTDDEQVDILDAQQIARFAVRLSVSNPTALSVRGDVTADGRVSIIDAQQVARAAVRLPAAARINTELFTVPSVATVSMTETVSLPLGGGSVLAPIARDSGLIDISGCLSFTYRSDNPAVVGVSADGQLTAVGLGQTTVTASAGAVSRVAQISVVRPAIMTIGVAPVGAVSSTFLSVQPAISVRDGNGQPVVSPRTISASVVSGNGVLGGTRTVTAVNGIAAFTDLSITGSGPQVLRFSSEGLTDVESAPLSITPPTGIRLLVGSAPSLTAVAGGEVTVPLLLDMSGRGTDNLAALTVAVTWDPQRYVYVGTAEGTWTDDDGSSAMVTVNASQAGTGVLLVTGFTPGGTTRNALLRSLVLRAVSAGGVEVGATVRSAGNLDGLPIAVGVRPLGGR